MSISQFPPPGSIKSTQRGAGTTGSVINTPVAFPITRINPAKAIVRLRNSDAMPYYGNGIITAVTETTISVEARYSSALIFFEVTEFW